MRGLSAITDVKKRRSVIIIAINIITAKYMQDKTKLTGSWITIQNQMSSIFLLRVIS